MKMFGGNGGRNVDMVMSNGAPEWLSDVGTSEAAGALPAAQTAAELGMGTPATGAGGITLAELSPAEAAAAEYGALDTGTLSALAGAGTGAAADAAGAAGLTAMGTPDLAATQIGALPSSAFGGAGGSAGAGAGATLGGLGIGLGAMATIPIFANYMDKHHTMTKEDYLRQWNGQMQAAKDRGDTAGVNTLQAMINQTNAGNQNFTTNRDPGYQRNAKQFACGGLSRLKVG
jgi:hypothetical protein